MRKRFKVTIFVESSSLNEKEIAEKISWYFPNIADSYLVIPDDNIMVQKEPWRSDASNDIIAAQTQRGDLWNGLKF